MIFIVATNHDGLFVEERETQAEADDFCAQFIAWHASHGGYGAKIILMVEGKRLALPGTEQEQVNTLRMPLTPY